MDKSLKLKCEYREHQDYNINAECKLFTKLSKITTKFDPSICEYCINAQPKLNLDNEPFKSQYYRLLNNNHELLPISFEYANCIMLGDPINLKHGSISEYLRSESRCHYYGTCTIVPNGNRSCQFCSDRLKIEYLFNKDPNFNIYKKRQKFGDKIKKWAVGVVTAPRKISTITKTIKALEKAGWENGIIFAEPNSYIYQNNNWEYVHRSKRLGIFGNWMLGLYELFIRNIDADAFFMIQDDILVPPNTRNYLERSLWFTETPHLVSLFGMFDNDPEYQWREVYKYEGGPNSIIMSHETVQEILSSLIPLQYYGIQSKKNTSFDDLGIFSLMSKNNWPTFYPKPSISDHIGHYSTHCQQTSRWIYSDRVLCNHQYNDVEHWFIIDNRSKSNLSDLKKNLQQYENINWLIIEDDMNVESYLKDKCKTNWIITTKLMPEDRLLSDIRNEIIKFFTYDELWIKFGFGKVNDKYIYTENGSCKTLCEKTCNLKTCLSELNDNIKCYIIKNGGVFWSKNVAK